MAKSQKRRNQRPNPERSISPSEPVTPVEMIARFAEQEEVEPEKVEAQLQEIGEATGNTIPIVDEEYVKSVVKWVKAQTKTIQVQLDATRIAEARSSVYLCADVLSKTYQKQDSAERQKKLDSGLDTAAVLFEREMSLLNG